MEVSYGMVNDVYGYGTQNASQNSKSAFTIPNIDEDIAGTASASAQKNNVSVKVDMMGPNWYEKAFYDPFKTSNVTLPEWMQTKTEPKRSDAEILKEMEELAKLHAKTGQFQYSDEKFKELMDEYMSSVSPDRAGILEKSVNEINERIVMEMFGMAGTKEDPAEEAKKKSEELIDYLMTAMDAKKGNGKDKGKNDTDIISSLIAARGNIASSSDGYYTAVDIDRGDGKVTTLVYDNQGNKMPWFTMKGDMYDRVSVQNGKVSSAFFNDSDDQIVMIYSNGNDNKDGIRQITTKAEHARRKELQAVYNAVYDFSVGRYNSHEQPNINGAMLTNVNGIENTNALTKEIYDSTYERLMSEKANSVA
ncbi:MAG: hypothetical protein LBU89_13445 [Fibromonadaceae bacterium]|nr:hypothetical protein [Fibromonadaceae bacterium]